MMQKVHFRLTSVANAIHHTTQALLGMLLYFHSKKIRIRYVWTRIFPKRGKKSPFESGYVWTWQKNSLKAGAKILLATCQLVHSQSDIDIHFRTSKVDRHECCLKIKGYLRIGP